MATQHTTNKSDRELGSKFDINQFNKKFSDNEDKIKQENVINKSKDIIRNDEIIYNKLPHQKPIEDVIINIRELFYKILEMLLDKENPIPYIFASADRQFAFSILIIVIGTLLLLFSNLMMSPSNDK
jgi:hypothetical protein